MAFPSARKSVLSTPELLRTIFEFSSGDDNLNNALVCKAWTHEALSAFWHTVVNFNRLLNLLGPTEGSPHDRRFVRHPSPDDWERFIKCSSQVRVIQDDYMIEALSSKMLLTLASTRPTVNLFPNLHTLKYGFLWSPLYLPLFLQTRLRYLRIDCEIWEGIVEWQDFTIDYLPSRTPYLQALHISGDVFSGSPFVDLLSTTVSARNLPMLAELTLPTLTPTLIHNVASLPALERLEIVAYDLWPLPVEHHTATLDDFPSLKSLTVMFNQSSVLDFLSQFKFLELTKLYLYPDLETPQEYERFLHILAAKLPQQKAFGIETSYQGHWGGGFLSYDVLRYILPCKNLQILDLEKVVTCLRGEELTSLTQALPFLVSLKLNNDVSHQDLFLSALESMIPHCLKLKHLHLNFTRSTEVLEASTGKRFSRLISLRTRTIPASDPVMIATYLRAILPQQCCISGLSDSLDKDCCLFWDNVVEECKYLRCKSNDDA